MKSFIVAALLVACVAGQSMDLWKLTKEKSLLNKFERPIMSELLMKKTLGYPVEKSWPWTYGDNTDYPVYTPEEEYLNKKVIHLPEEIMEHPLFREYIHLPLFRQFWTYPAFQKYVTSVYFQRFWHIPAFKQYFYNPVLFYKYIYPIVTLFKTEFTYPTTTSIYGDEYIKNDWNKDTTYPVVTGFERDLLKDKLFVPTMYNEELKLKDDLLVKTLLVKIYSHLYNIPEELVKEHIFTTPFTREHKWWSDKYTTTEQYPWEYTTTPYHHNWESTVYGDKLNKEVLLKKYLLNKMMKKGDETYETYKTIIPEEVILREKMMKMNPLVHRMMTYNKVPTFYNKFETIETPFEKKDFIKDEIKKELVKDEIKKELIKDELKKEFLLKKFVTEKEFEPFKHHEIEPKVVDFTTPMMGVRTFDKKVFPETIIKA